jgi:hypothetical protein
VQDSVRKTPIDTSEVTVPTVERIAIGGAIETLTNVPYVCTSAEYEWSKNPDQLIMYSPATDILWPGGLIQGKSYKQGALLGLTIAEREPINVSIPALPTGRNFRTIPLVDQAHVAGAIGEMVGDATDSDLAVGAATSFRLETFHSEQSFALSANASGRYLGFSLAVGGATSRTTAETTVTVHFAQKMFEVVVAPPQSPGAFFSPAFTSDKLQQQVSLGRIGSDNLPVYVASVVYGRMMMFSFTSTASESEIKATLNASYRFAVGDVRLELDAQQQKILSARKFRSRRLRQRFRHDRDDRTGDGASTSRRLRSSPPRNRCPHVQESGRWQHRESMGEHAAHRAELPAASTSGSVPLPHRTSDQRFIPRRTAPLRGRKWGRPCRYRFQSSERNQQ